MTFIYISYSMLTLAMAGMLMAIFLHIRFIDLRGKRLESFAHASLLLGYVSIPLIIWAEVLR